MIGAFKKYEGNLKKITEVIKNRSVGSIRKAIVRYKLALGEEPVRLKPKPWTFDEDSVLLNAIEAN